MKTFIKLYREACREQRNNEIAARRHRLTDAYCLAKPDQSFQELFYFRLEEMLGLAI